MIGATPTALPEVVIIEPRVHGDARGFFLESYNARDFDAAVGDHVTFVQDNLSRSATGVLRGIHYQIRAAQGKLVRVVRGAIFDVAVDLRRRSPRFGQWVGVELAEDNHRALWIPAGFGHGFLVTGGPADVLYKATDFYAPEHERCIRWDDPTVGIDWPTEVAPVVSERDARGTAFEAAQCYE